MCIDSDLPRFDKIEFTLLPAPIIAQSYGAVVAVKARREPAAQRPWALRAAAALLAHLSGAAHRICLAALGRLWSGVHISSP